MREPRGQNDMHASSILAVPESANFEVFVL